MTDPREQEYLATHAALCRCGRAPTAEYVPAYRRWQIACHACYDGGPTHSYDSAPRLITGTGKTLAAAVDDWNHEIEED